MWVRGLLFYIIEQQQQYFRKTTLKPDLYNDNSIFNFSVYGKRNPHNIFATRWGIYFSKNTLYSQPTKLVGNTIHLAFCFI